MEQHISISAMLQSERHRPEPPCKPSLIALSNRIVAMTGRLRHYCRCVPVPATRWLWRTRRNIRFLHHERAGLMTSSNGQGIGDSMRRHRAVRVSAAASGLAIVLVCGPIGPALAEPSEPRQVHVEGQIVPVAKSPGVYRVSGGLVGTYKLRSETVINEWTYWTTQIRDIEGTEAIKGCVDENQNESCDAGEPSGEMRLNFNRVASFDTSTGRLLASRSSHRVDSSGRFAGGLLEMRDLPVGGSEEIVSTYVGDLQVTEAQVDSKRAD